MHFGPTITQQWSFGGLKTNFWMWTFLKTIPLSSSFKLLKKKCEFVIKEPLLLKQKTDKPNILGIKIIHPENCTNVVWMGADWCISVCQQWGFRTVHRSGWDRSSRRDRCRWIWMECEWQLFISYLL